MTVCLDTEHRHKLTIIFPRQLYVIRGWAEISVSLKHRLRSLGKARDDKNSIISVDL